MDTIRLCRRCGAQMPTDTPGAPCQECGGAPGAVALTEQADGLLMAPSVADLAPLFPGLEIVEVIGQGGMGTIYKARQPQLDRCVALKILSPELGRDAAFAHRFSREAQALAKLNHSNIVGVFDFGQAGSYYYFLMEYVDGVTLRTLIEQRSVGPHEAQRIVIEICHALQYAHDEGIVHRDIKPSNILLDKKGRVKIADFGLARLVGKDGNESSTTQTTVILGTPHYMAPEQIEKPGKVDRRADIYALGVVLYEMLTNELPIGQFELPSKITSVDPCLDSVVWRAMQKEPRRRFKNANEFRSAVETATGHFHHLPGDMRRARRQKWKWLPRFALVAVTIWLAAVTYIMLKDHLAEQKSVLIPAGALEAFAAGPEGVGLNRHMAAQMQLDKNQLLEVNKIIKKYQREFTTLERRHTDRSTDAAGHLVVTIKPFPEEMDALMDHLWADLGTVLNAGQIATGKTLHFERFFPHTGRRLVSVEIWQDENGEFHYVEQQPAGKNGAGGAGALVPPRYRGWFRDNQKTNE